jgi:spermidine synthase
MADDENDTLSTGVLFALVTVAGMAALAWEVLFRHMIALSLGTSAGATAVTLAVTMGGMTTGALAAGRLLAKQRQARPFVLYGALEAMIGLSALLVGPLLTLSAHVDTIVHRSMPAVAPLSNVVLVALPLIVPTVAMGATVPVLSLIARSTRAKLAHLYGANTLGAALGTLLIAFALLPLLGVQRATILVALVDGSIALVAFGLGRSVRVDMQQADSADRAPTKKSNTAREASTHPSTTWVTVPAVAFAVAATTGTVTFVVEVAGFRGLIATLWSTTEAFALMLFAVLLSLGLAASVASRIVSRISLGGTLALAGVLVVVMTPLIARFEEFIRFPDAYFWRMTSWGALSLAVLGLPVLVLGTPLPFLLDEAVRDPRRVAHLYGINTLGAVVGALATAWIALPAIGFVWTLIVTGLLTVVVALIIAENRVRVPIVLATCGAMACAIAFDDGAGRTRAPGRTGSAAPHRLLAIREGPDVTTAVIERENGSRALLIDGFAATEESSPAHYMAWMGHLPMMLHERPEAALVICFGTGQTAHAVRLEGPRTLDVVDVNPAVFDMASYFRTNRGVLSDPRVKTHVMDGRAFLRRTEQRFDVVTLEPMPPTFAGVNNLYSEEFYRLVDEKLADGGILAQWLPFHIVSPSDSRAITASFHAVFKDTALWVDPASGTGILVGRKGTARTLGTTLPGGARPDLGRSLAPEMVMQMMFLLPDGVERYARDAGRVTDDNQRLAYGLDRIDRHTELLGRANKKNLEDVLEIARATRGNAVPSMR